MTQEIIMALEAPFKADEIEWRVLRTTKDKTRGQVAAYVDSRAIQRRLDSVLGRDNWQNELVTVLGVDNSVAAHICKLKFYSEEKNEWIMKCDGAGSTDIEPIKGGLSNAFKRAASMWGVGRYLYGLKNIWANLDEYKCIAESERPRLDDIYDTYLKKLSSGGTVNNQQKNGNHSAKNAPAQNKANEKPVQQQGRFAGKPAQPENIYKITAIRFSNGSNGGTNTKVALSSPTGQSIIGYIKGRAELKEGDGIINPKIISKNDSIIGNYNIIESYEKAA